MKLTFHNSSFLRCKRYFAKFRDKIQKCSKTIPKKWQKCSKNVLKK